MKENITDYQIITKSVSKSIVYNIYSGLKLLEFSMEYIFVFSWNVSEPFNNPTELRSL